MIDKTAIEECLVYVEMTAQERGVSVDSIVAGMMATYIYKVRKQVLPTALDLPKSKRAKFKPVTIKVLENFVDQYGAKVDAWASIETVVRKSSHKNALTELIRIGAVKKIRALDCEKQFSGVCVDGLTNRTYLYSITEIGLSMLGLKPEVNDAEAPSLEIESAAPLEHPMTALDDLFSTSVSASVVDPSTLFN
jgi:hypothetical protein